ncbi:DUF2167 domain-containing protein [Pedobacter sp. SYSU D00535]|uniref:DUF2167 domain-containing protein n=1 Tax=Pedobacter sp. SYSU D00535 TaxID=2810308 RepID=UPI001A95FACA|nr:DUF2167 domain-containing protein [Pedobacter sp. SYSU D00535]
MKKILLLFLAFLIHQTVLAQQEDTDQKFVDSVEKSFKYQYGVIKLGNGIGSISVPKGFKYLEPVQAEKVLTDYWGNPKGENLTLGLLLREDQNILDAGGYVFNIQYDEIGYVKDDDADDIDYDELLKEIQEETKEENKEREKAGYEPVTIVGWAAKPFYDKDRKILHWAKEAKFGKATENTLNYNIRVLGRKGVLVLNAIASMGNLAQVQKDVPQVLNIVQFEEGFTYADFNPDLDEVATWTIGGLVAGKVLAKTGILVMLFKFWKFILIGLAAVAGPIWRRITGRKEEKEEEMAVTEVENPSSEEEKVS